jgi:hypothetical protein
MSYFFILPFVKAVTKYWLYNVLCGFGFLFKIK